MARGTTLLRLLDMFRAEARISLNPAHNRQARDAQVNHLQRVQDWLWEDFAWPLLRVERYIDVQTGQRFYAMPDDLDIDRISKIEIRHDDVYCPLSPGIDEVQYAAYDSERDQRSWPPRRWRIYEDEQLEVWPIPDANVSDTSLDGRIKITGIRKLRRLVQDSDRVDLDDRLIALFAAAEHLAATGAKDAGLKLDQAKGRYLRLRGHQMPRRRYALFGLGRPDRVRRIPIALYNKPSP